VLLPASCFLLVAGALRCARQAVSPSARPVRVFVTDASLERFPAYAAEVKARQAISPTIWLVTGALFTDRSLAVMSDGAAQVTLLSRAGVDAVVMSTDWLAFGPPRLEQIVSNARFYALSANLLDSTGSTLGHPFMVRGSGSAVLALTGLAFDSADILTCMAGIRYAAPEFAARKTVALMRQRADFVGVMVEPRASGASWDADFAVNSDGPGQFSMLASGGSSQVNCYDVAINAGQVSARTSNLGRLGVDSTVALVLDSVKEAVDSIASKPLPLPRGTRTPEALSRVLVDGLLAAKLADGFLCDSLFVADFKEPKDVGTLVGLLRDPNRLAVLSVAGDVLAGWPEGLMLGPSLSRSRLSRAKMYRIATTVEYLRRHPALAAAGFNLTARPFWTICRDVLESGQAK